MKLATWHWHIEISSKCTLKCLRCARTEVPSTLVSTELSLDFFKKNFTPEFIQANVEKITFCGDDGDPIYAKSLIEVIRYIKSVKPVKFVIVTNGSYKGTEWWQQLGISLDCNDHIHFSLDGWDQESNEQYRVNSDWASIVRGIESFRWVSKAYMTWDAIAFKFNQDHLDVMKELARQLRFDQFQLTLSTKFNKVYSNYPEGDILQPRDELISDTHRFQREYTYFNERRPSDVGLATNIKLYNQTTSFDQVTPLCGIGNKGLFINSQGHLFPCCWVANRYTHNNEWLELSKNQFDLNKRSLKEVLNDSYWGEEFEIFSRAECRTKCNKAVVNQQYATEW
jgi:MoaA/NifB/PqqE/SkfB family radical SAM enzyme